MIFVCQHRTPDVFWRPELMNHPNRAGGILEVWQIASDPAALGPLYRALLGDAALRESEGMVRGEVGNARVQVVTEQVLRRHFQQIDLPERLPIGFFGMSLHLPQLDVAREGLAARRHPAAAEGEVLWLAPASADGVLLQLRRQRPA